MPDERGEEGEDRPTDEDAEGQSPEGTADDRAEHLEEPVRVTPVKVVRWVPKAAPHPPGTTPPDGIEPLRGEGAPGEEGALFTVVEDEGHDTMAPFEAAGEGDGSAAPFEVVDQTDEGTATFEVQDEPGGTPAPFEVVGGDHRPAPTESEESPFQVVDEQNLAFTEVAEGDAGDEGGPSAAFEEEIEMEPALELRDEESAKDKEAPPPRRPPAPPAPPQAPDAGPLPGRPSTPQPGQTPPRTLTGIPITPASPPSRRPPEPAMPTRPPAAPLAEVSPPPPPAVEEPKYAKYFRPDEDAIRPRDQGPPSGFDRDLETEAGEIDIGIELDRPGDKWKRDKSSARRPKEAKKAGPRVVGGRDMDSEVGTRDVGPDIGVNFERRKRRRL